MHVISQIIEKNLPHMGTGLAGLWINPATDNTWRQATEHCRTLQLFCQDFDVWQYHQQAGADTQFGAFPKAVAHGYEWIIVNLPRQKALLDMLLECAASLLSDTGELWLAGENRAGINSADKRLKCYFKQHCKLDNARHCVLWSATAAREKAPFNALAHRREWHLVGQQSDLKICSYPGVFNHGRLDQGTALLLSTLTSSDSAVKVLDVPGNTLGKVLDFGCGAGVVGASVRAANSDSEVTFLDNNALALTACEETLRANQLPGAVLASNGFSEIQQKFDLILSNPPIHTGVKTDNTLGMRVLGAVHEHLKPGGQLLIVANRHLPYETWLAGNFRRVSMLLENRHFKVLLARL